MRCGFINKKENSPIPLEKVQIYGSIKGFTAEIVATMEYKNNGMSPIEAIYIFPLDEEAAVWGFQATIDGRTIEAEIQGKEEARDTYDDALSSGHSAFLLEESDESSDIFQINVGNLPPKQSATVVLKFVTTLKVQQEGKVVFVLPTVLNPRYSPADSKPSITTQFKDIASVNSQYVFDFDMTVECASAIQEITSPNQDLKVDINTTNNRKAFVQLDKNLYKFNTDLEVHVLCSDAFKPHALVEKGTTDDQFIGKHIAMVNFFPQFDASASLERGEFIFVVDRSGSMGGSNIQGARESLLLFLKSLPEDCFFNIVGFGSHYEKLFEQSTLYNDKSLKIASSYAESMEADFGGTEILRPLQEVFSLPLIKGHPRQVFILTDGAVGNTKQVIDLVKVNCDKSRCFTFGIGSGASTALVKGIARAGKGVAEFVAFGEKMQPKVIRVLKNALQPALVDCTISWDLPAGCSVENIPQVSPPIFSGNSLIIYGLVTGDWSFHGNVTITGSLMIDSTVNQIQHKVNLDGVLSTENSNLLHRLAAKSFIQERQSHMNIAEEEIVKMSKSANVVSKFTSFVAVDQESKKPVTRPLMLGLEECETMMAAPMSMPLRCGARPRKLSKMKGKVARKSAPTSFNSSSVKRERGFSAISEERSTYRDMWSSRLARRDECIAFDELSDSDGEKDTKRSSRLASVSLDKSSKSIAFDELSDSDGDKDTMRSSQLSFSWLDLICLQKASGFWELTTELVGFFGISIERMKESCPPQLTTVKKDSIWATALALACLNLKFPNYKDQWEMVALKGTKWLKKNAQNISCDELLAQAIVVLQQA